MEILLMHDLMSAAVVSDTSPGSLDIVRKNFTLDCSFTRFGGQPQPLVYYIMPILLI